MTRLRSLLTSALTLGIVAGTWALILAANARSHLSSKDSTP